MTKSLAGPVPFVFPVVLPPVLVTRASTSKALRPFAAPPVFPPSMMLGPLMCGFIFLPSQPIGCLAGAVRATRFVSLLVGA
jgi:hypothetical protein